jgi:hypothetical protein
MATLPNVLVNIMAVAAWAALKTLIRLGLVNF